MNLHERRRVKVGLEKILANPKEVFGSARVGLICNQASVDRNFRHAADLFFAHPEINLTTLFGPQHGIRGEVQDNMIETAHSVDSKTNLPVYSLYSETREPTAEMLKNVDVLVFDLQDVGCRVYTFIYTMANAMKACAANNVKFVVADRPNPINGIDVEGNLLEKGHESFVGMYPIPMRHGMTCGELAQMFNHLFAINCELQVVAMDDWSRELFLDETDAPWVIPSPNMPTVDTAVVFPGTVFFEGTEVSEGRGTTRPFEFVGAPYIDGEVLAESLRAAKLPGVIFRPTGFMPTFQKHAGKSCGGVFLHVIDRTVFKPVLTGIALARIIRELYPEDFSWKTKAYEYVFDRNPFDVIAGTTGVRESFEKDPDIHTTGLSWKQDETTFKEQRESYLMY